MRGAERSESRELSASKRGGIFRTDASRDVHDSQLHGDHAVALDHLTLITHTFVLTDQDSSIIATGSADRNVKIWGLDFGDCHRSMFAHDDR